MSKEGEEGEQNKQLFGLLEKKQNQMETLTILERQTLHTIKA